MSTTTVSNMKVYDDLTVGAYYERIAQNIDTFNAASSGALVLATSFIQGDFAKESFFKNFSGLSRRDDTSTAAAAAAQVVQDEDVSVKLKRKFLAEATHDAFRTMGYSVEDFAQICGEQMADETKQEVLATMVAALNATLSGIATNNKDVSGAGSNSQMSHVNLNAARALLGDKSSGIKAWCMSGAAFHALLGNMLGGTAPQFNDSGISVYNGNVPTLGLPVIVTDVPALETDGKFTVLGLREAAVVATISEATDVINADVTGQENLIRRVQGEGAYNLSVRGFKWDVAAGRNPTAGTIATSGSWIRNATSHKDLAGVRLVVAQ